MNKQFAQQQHTELEMLPNSSSGFFYNPDPYYAKKLIKDLIN